MCCFICVILYSILVREEKLLDLCWISTYLLETTTLHNDMILSTLNISSMALLLISRKCLILMKIVSLLKEFS